MADLHFRLVNADRRGLRLDGLTSLIDVVPTQQGVPQCSNNERIH